MMTKSRMLFVMCIRKFMYYEYVYTPHTYAIRYIFLMKIQMKNSNKNIE